MTPSPLVRVSDAGSVEVMVSRKCLKAGMDGSAAASWDDWRRIDSRLAELGDELRQLRALAEERRLGPREG